MWRAVRRGLGCTLLGQGLNLSIGFGLYETLNVYALAKGETRTNMFGCLWCGAVAGFFASVCTHPLDLIRRRQQMGSDANTLCLLKEVFAKQGVGGLYKGIMPELIKVVPAVGLNFWIYEYLRQEVFKSKIHPR